MAKRGKKYTSAAAMVDRQVKLPLNEALALRPRRVMQNSMNPSTWQFVWGLIPDMLTRWSEVPA